MIGGTLMLAGVVMLAWVGWQFFGTNWVSDKRHGEVVAALEQGWSSDQESVTTDFGVADAILTVPRFGDDYAVPILEGDSDEVLAAGVGHLDDTANVGKIGNYVIAAHRITHGEPFADLPSLRPGDEVEIRTRAATYIYELDTGGTDLIVPFTASWVLEPRPTNPNPGGVSAPGDVGERLITLVTCSELFHTDNRSVVFGHLVERIPAR
ncbi:hypothetical protein GCM10027020_09840 [Nocardioides salsibiostraticola]